MDDLQFWLYVIIGVIYLISQVRKKAKQQQGPPTEKPLTRKPTSQSPTWQRETATPTSGQKPMTFEDLLREITEAKTMKDEPEYETYEKPEYDYDTDIEAEKLEPEVVDYRNTDSIYQKYEDAKTKDYSINSLEESLKLEEVDMKFGKFKEFEAESKVNLLDLYTKDLRDPEGLKKAVILTEILSPRHF